MKRRESQVPDFLKSNDPSWFLRLVDIAQDPASAQTWSASELGALWNHQLDARLVKCIEELGLVHALHCQTLCANAKPPITSLRDLLTCTHPDVELLILVARWMERALGDPEELLPREVALSLFNIALVLARLSGGANLINGTDGGLARRAEWVATRPWMDGFIAKVMSRACAELGQADSGEIAC